MRNQFLLFVLIFLAFPAWKSNAQIAIAVAKDDNSSVIDYKLEWGYNFQFEASNAARKFLENKGYKKVFSPSAEGSNIPKGFYVVIKSTYKDYKGKDHTSLGLGASATSREEAEKNAIIDIAAHDWSWRKDMGYKVVETGQFSGSGVKNCAYIIPKVKNAQCGDYDKQPTVMIGYMDKKSYDKLKTGVENNCSKNKKPMSEMGRFMVSKRYVAILECLQVCPADQKPYSHYKIIEVGSEEELKIIASMSPGELFHGSGYGYFVKELIDLQGEDSFKNMPSIFLGYLRIFLENNPDLYGLLEPEAKNMKFVSIGVRD